MSLSMDEFRKQLQEAVLAAQEQARRAGPQPWHGFWKQNRGQTPIV